MLTDTIKPIIASIHTQMKKKADKKLQDEAKVFFEEHER